MSRLHQGHRQQLALLERSPSTSSMPSRSSMTLSTRCAGPNEVDNVLAVLAILAPIRSTCPTDSEPHRNLLLRHRRPHVQTASGWRSRNSMTNPTPDAATVFEEAELLEPTAGCCESSMRAHCQVPLERIRAGPQQESEWPHRGIKARPSRQSKARGHRSVRNLKAMVYLLEAKSISCFQTEIVATHAKQRRTSKVSRLPASPSAARGGRAPRSSRRPGTGSGPAASFDHLISVAIARNRAAPDSDQVTRTRPPHPFKSNLPWPTI